MTLNVNVQLILFLCHINHFNHDVIFFFYFLFEAGSLSATSKHALKRLHYFVLITGEVGMKHRSL